MFQMQFLVCLYMKSEAAIFVTVPNALSSLLQSSEKYVVQYSYFYIYSFC